MDVQQNGAIEKAIKVHHGCLKPEIHDGNIKCIDVCELSDEELGKMCYHFSLKINQPFINKNGLVPKIGNNSKGMDTEKLIFFSYGLQGVIELWDFWLKWRANKLFNPWYQEEERKIVKAFRNGTVSEKEQHDFFEKYGIRIVKNDSIEGMVSDWDEEFISGEYKKDKNKMNYLFEYQINELIASNYYVLDLIEGKDFSFDETDKKKQTMLTWKRNSINYRVYETMLKGHSNLDSIKVDKWNMTTKTGERITITPERIKQLIVPNCPNDALRVLLFLYDKYKKILPADQQVETELLDNFIKYVKSKIREGILQIFNRTSEQKSSEVTSFFHDQKSVQSFEDTRPQWPYICKESGFTVSTKDIFAVTERLPWSKRNHAQKLAAKLLTNKYRDFDE